jgi:hypothetical protein
MSFREKSAWISFVCILVAGGVWLWNIVRMEIYHVHVNPILFALSLLASFIVAEAVLHLAVASRAPGEARTPRDEREQAIDLKAVRIAFYVLLAGAWMSIGTIHLRFNGLEVSHCVLGSIIVAELSKFGTQIVLYRRDA